MNIKIRACIIQNNLANENTLDTKSLKLKTASYPALVISLKMGTDLQYTAPVGDLMMR